MSSRAKRSIKYAASILIVGGLAGASQAADPPPYGTDVSPPTLTLPIKPSFVVGNVLAEPTTGDLSYITSNIKQSFSWSATDPSTVREYDVGYVTTDGYFGSIVAATSDTSYVDTVSDYDDEQGGGSGRIDGWTVTARDNVANAVTRRIYGGSGDNVGVTQENNVSKWRDPSPYGVITYSGSWSVTNCACHLMGHAQRTSALNARATFTRTYSAGGHVALVMAMGPGRGRAAIRVDGVVVQTIDTYASVNTNRVVVFERLMAAGVHTVSVTNLATSGRPRIDLDAVMTN